MTSHIYFYAFWAGWTINNFITLRCLCITESWSSHSRKWIAINTGWHKGQQEKNKQTNKQKNRKKQYMDKEEAKATGVLALHYLKCTSSDILQLWTINLVWMNWAALHQDNCFKWSIANVERFHGMQDTVQYRLCLLLPKESYIIHLVVLWN